MLTTLREKILADGKAAVESSLKLANEQLQRQFPNVPVLSADDLQAVKLNPNDGTYVAFSRNGKGKGDDILVEVEMPIKGEPKVKVTVSPNPGNG